MAVREIIGLSILGAVVMFCCCAWVGSRCSECADDAYWKKVEIRNQASAEALRQAVKQADEQGVELVAVMV